MSRYDQPGFTGAFPTGPLDAGSLSNAPGSAGIPSNTNVGPVLGEPVVSSQYVSSQLPEGQATHPVHAGDTSSFSDDIAAHASVIDGVGGAAFLDTGAGSGHVVTSPHPNAGR